jgi:hypothetical protein
MTKTNAEMALSTAESALRYQGSKAEVLATLSLTYATLAVADAIREHQDPCGDQAQEIPIPFSTSNRG